MGHVVEGPHEVMMTRTAVTVWTRLCSQSLNILKYRLLAME